jgi:indole-3-glycerol phosphate synthase
MPNPSDFLARILAHKREQLHAAYTKLALAQLEQAVRELPPPCDFSSALRAGEEIAIIAEMKKASPSAGVLREDFSPAAIAASYARHGAAALSVLTDEEFFQGSFDHLRLAQQACTLPILCKDFIVDAHQILSARVAGADAVLLIVAALQRQELASLLRQAEALGMGALVEVHDEAEVEIALALGARNLGVNHRDLRTFEISLQLSARLMPLIPSACTRVAESGIRSRSEVEYLRDLGVDAILVGTHFMRQPEPGRALQQLKGVARKCFP